MAHRTSPTNIGLYLLSVITARDFVAIVKEALEAGFLPAAPDARECDWCDYKRVCGPYEEIRTRKKS